MSTQYEVQDEAFVTGAASIPLSEIRMVRTGRSFLGWLFRLAKWLFGIRAVSYLIAYYQAVNNAASGDAEADFALWAVMGAGSMSALFAGAEEYFGMRLLVDTPTKTYRLPMRGSATYKAAYAIKHAQKPAPVEANSA